MQHDHQQREYATILWRPLGLGKKKKVIPSNNMAQRPKEPKNIQNPESFYDQTPVWSFSRCDFDHSKWGICSETSCVESVLKKLGSFEGQNWKDILCDTSGRNGNTKHHQIETHRIIKEAQARLNEINMGQYDTLYSMSISGKIRLWGIINQGVFFIIWLDRNHEICPSGKRHT